MPQPTSLPSVPETVPVINDERILKGLECLLLSEPLSIPTTMTAINDESFLRLEQGCKMDCDVFIDRSRRKTTIETNIAVIMTQVK